MFIARRLALAAIPLLAGIHLANAQSSTQASVDPVSVDHAWSRPTPGGATTGVIYLTVTANGQADRLIGASTPAADKAELHETTNDNGVMKMRPVDGLALTPGTPVVLKPGSYHIMLFGLKKPLKTGDSVQVTLTFAQARPVTLTVPVATMSGDMGHAMSHGMSQGMPQGMPQGMSQGTPQGHDMGSMPGIKP